MSEIKITENSLENAILKDGQFVSGYVNGINSCILSNGAGAHAEGYVRTGVINASGNGTTIIGAWVNGDSSIIIGGKGSHGGGLAGGIADGSSSINLDNWGSIAYGMAKINSSISVGGGGAVAFGQANTNSAINANGNGAFAGGYAYNGGTINASGNGAHAEGYVLNSSIISNGIGSFVTGCASTNSIINASSEGGIAMGCAEQNSSIISKGYGAIAMGYAKNGTINTSGSGAHAEGYVIDSSIISKGKGSFVVGCASSNCIINASDEGGIAMGCAVNGSSINSNGLGSIAMGCAQNTGATIFANGTGAIAMGCAYNSGDVSTLKADGPGAAAIGFGVQAKGSGAFACGYGTIADSNYMAAVGKFNLSDNTENTLFAVGNGINSAKRSNAFRVNNETNSVPSSVQAKVNGVPDVYLGCPIGTVIMWAGDGENVPNGWLLCNGRGLDPYDTNYSKLYNVIGTTYGGDGTNAFLLPNFKGLFPVGAGKGTDSNGQTYEFTLGTYTHINYGPGEYQHKLTIDEMPSHQHSIQMSNGNVGTTYVDDAGDSGTPYPYAYTGMAGSDEYHNNIPPYFAINFIIKYK